MGLFFSYVLGKCFFPILIEVILSSFLSIIFWQLSKLSFHSATICTSNEKISSLTISYVRLISRTRERSKILFLKTRIFSSRFYILYHMCARSVNTILITLFQILYILLVNCRLQAFCQFLKWVNLPKQLSELERHRLKR